LAVFSSQPDILNLDRKKQKSLATREAFPLHTSEISALEVVLIADR
jgi:hypothetical protein